MKPLLLTERKNKHSFRTDLTEVKATIIVGRDAQKLISWDEDETKWKRIYGISQYCKVKNG